LTRNVVIVESPAKAKTIKKYLGKDFEVMASYGHVRDLVPKEGAVDPTRKFAMRWEIIDKNRKHVDAIARAVKKADALYLSTDPDREGEAISWHLYELLKDSGALDGKSVHRSVFYEITRNAVQEAVEQPREISQELVKAYLARRALDYLVGFNLSPLLWKKAGLSGASAGRVQSPALRMICEREEEIAAFVAREYWTIDAQAEKDAQQFGARLTQFRGEKVEQFTITTAARADEVRGALNQAAAGNLTVANVDRKQRKRNPAPAFHHLDAATGGRAEARLRRAAHHARGPAALRGHGFRRGTDRSHHLHAHRLGEPRSRGRARDPLDDRAAVWRGSPAGCAANVSHQVEECPGGARGRAPDVALAYARAARGQARRG
jgi:DNA topoisomerase-1